MRNHDLRNPARLWLASILAALCLPAADLSAQPIPSIKAVQTLLCDEQIYSGEVNGVLDFETIAGIRRFQVVHGLRVTGWLDEPTVTEMNLPPPSLPKPWTDADKNFLRQLSALGDPSGPVPELADAGEPGQTASIPGPTRKPQAAARPVPLSHSHPEPEPVAARKTADRKSGNSRAATQGTAGRHRRIAGQRTKHQHASAHRR